MCNSHSPFQYIRQLTYIHKKLQKLSLCVCVCAAISLFLRGKRMSVLVGATCLNAQFSESIFEVPVFSLLFAHFSKSYDK